VRSSGAWSCEGTKSKYCACGYSKLQSTLAPPPHNTNPTRPPTRPQDLQQACKQYVDADRIPWRLAQSLCARSRSPGAPQTPAWLHAAACGSAVLLRSPAPRARSAALEKRLEALQGELDNKRYAEMVADVTVNERRLEAFSSEMFPSTRLQLSFGLNVVVTMGAFCALGWIGMRWSTGSDAWVRWLISWLVACLGWGEI